MNAIYVILALAAATLASTLLIPSNKEDKPVNALSDPLKPHPTKP